MPSTAQPLLPPHVAAGYTGMDDILIPNSGVSSRIKWELYPIDVISSGGVDDDVETTTKVYITSESFDHPVTSLKLADQWIALHSGPKSKFKLLTREAMDVVAASPVHDSNGKTTSPNFQLVFESQGVRDSGGNAMPHHFDDERYRQIIYLFPVSAKSVFIARVVRGVQYFQGFPQFEPQYKHFLSTLKRDTVTPLSTTKGSKPLTRRFYTAYFSFDVYLPEPDGGNQWLINKDSSQRTDVWHTKAGDVDVNMGVVSGYDFDPAQENKRLKENAKGLVSSLPGLISSMDGGKFRSKLVYIEVPFGSKSIYGHTDDDGFETEVDLTSAYKKGKKFHLYIRAPSATMAPMLPELYKWLAQFRIMD